MSYSFTIIADTKVSATAQIRLQMDKVAASQPTHAKDKEAAIEAGQAIVRVLAEPFHGDEIHVHMNGYLSWTKDDDIISANLNVRAELKSKPVDKA